MAMQVQKFEKKVNAEQKKLEMLEEYKQNLKKLQDRSLLENKKPEYPKTKGSGLSSPKKPRMSRAA